MKTSLQPTVNNVLVLSNIIQLGAFILKELTTTPNMTDSIEDSPLTTNVIQDLIISEFKLQLSNKIGA